MKKDSENPSLRGAERRSNLVQRVATRFFDKLRIAHNDVLIVIFFLAVTLLFFYPIFKGYMPFPGDLLVSLSPYSSYSYLGYAPGGVPNMAQGSDVIREAYPWKMFVIESLKNGILPFWTTNNFSGNQILANFQSAVFSPFNLLLFLQPFYFGWSIFILIAPFLAACFSYLFLQELKISKVASIFGGIVFAFSSYMVVWMEYGNISQTFLWLPLALFFTERLFKVFSKKYLVALIFSLLASLMSGYIQGFFYILVVVILYFFIKASALKELSIKKSLLFLIAIGAPVFLFLFQILPTLHLLSNSSRGSYSLSQLQYLLNPWWYAITVLIPNFFGHPAARNFWFNGTYIERVSYFGLIPFILALSALQAFRKNITVTIFSSIFVVTFLISLDLIITKYIYTLPIPMLTTSVPTRMLGIFQFCGSILAAFGLDFFIQKKEKRSIVIALSIVSFFILSALLFTYIAPRIFINSPWTAYMEVSKRNIFLPFLLTGSFAVLFFVRKYSRRFVTYAIVLITILDLFYFFHKITPFSPKEFIYPQTPVVSYLQQKAGINRFWGYGSAYISSNFQLIDKTYSPEGEDPLHIKAYTELLATSENGQFPATLPRPDANIASGFGQEDLQRNTYRQKILNITSVKFILNKDDSLGKEQRPDTVTFKENTYKLIWQDAPWQIYENLQVAPRIFLTNDYVVINDKNKFVNTFYSKSFDEKKTLILNEKPTENVSKFSKGSVKLLDYQNNKVSIKTKTDASALLFLSDTYYPSWNATIDGKITKVFLTDYAFRSIVVPQGEHTIEFYYDSEKFNMGLIFSGIVAILLTLFFIILKPLANEKNNN